jgi:ATP-dependent Clp protease protease subunit
MIHVPADDIVTTELMRRRVVLATGALDEAAAAIAAARLLLLDETEQTPITLHIACRDADVEAATTLAATIDLIRSEVTAIAVGAIEGAAVATYAAATHRLAHPHASFVLRDPAPHPTTDDVEVAAELHRRRLDEMHNRIAAAVGRRPAAVAADMHDGRLLTAGEAVGYGLVERLTSDR